MSLTNQGYVPSQPYFPNRLQEPPRIVVPPPPMLYDSSKALFTLQGIRPYAIKSDEYGNPEFIQSLVCLLPTSHPHRGVEWDYTERRKAQRILPFLFLGPSEVAKNVEFVRSQGITMMLAVRNKRAVSIHKKLLDPTRFASSEGIETFTLDVDSATDMMAELSQTIKTINNHLEESLRLVKMSGKVLVFCESGNERSAAVVAAYVMAVYGLSAVEALQFVQTQRFCLAIPESLKNMLGIFEGLLSAKRDVAAVGRYDDQQVTASRQEGQSMNDPSLLQSERATKRSHYDMYELDPAVEVDEIGTESAYESGGRSARAPFQDATLHDFSCLQD